MQRLALLIGLRFSKAKYRNKLVSFISMSSMIGIAVGVMVIIIGLSAMNGFERELEQRVLSVIPHVELEGVQGPVTTWQAIATTAERHPDVIAAAPYIKFTALLEKNAQIKPAQIRAIDPQAEAKISHLPYYVNQQGWQGLTPHSQGILLGKGIADGLGVQQGDWLTAIVPMSDADHTQQLKAPKRIRLQVVGILDLGGQLDQGLALVNLTDAQTLLAMADGVTGVALRINAPLDALTTAREVGATLNEYVYLKTWIQDYGFLYRDIQMVRTIVYIVMVLVIGVACFNIVSTLMMAVKDRASDIAVLRTMGAKDGLIRAIFIWHGLLSGLIGSLAGSLLGGAFSYYLTAIATYVERIIGHKFLSGDIYFVDFLPTRLMLSDVLLVCVTAIVLSLVATWYPARRACQLNPAVVLSQR